MKENEIKQLVWKLEISNQVFNICDFLIDRLLGKKCHIHPKFNKINFYDEVRSIHVYLIPEGEIYTNKIVVNFRRCYTKLENFMILNPDYHSLLEQTAFEFLT